MDMVALDQNLLYIILAVLVVVIILLAVFLRRRRSRDGPSNVNQYLAKEARLKKVQIVESQEGFQNKIPLYLRRTDDDLKDIREATSDLQHKTIYQNRKIGDKAEHLGSLDKQINLKRQITSIEKKYLELASPVKPKKEK